MKPLLQLLHRKAPLQLRQFLEHLKGYLMDYSIKYDSAAILQVLEDIQTEQPSTQGIQC